LGWACLGCLFPGCSTGAHSTRGRRVCCRFFKHCSVVLIICLFLSFMLLLVQTRRMRDADDARKANDASRWLYARDTSTANRRYTPAHARIPVPSATPESRRPPQARIDFIFSLCIRLAHTRRRQEHTQQYLFVYIRRLLHSRMNSADFFFFISVSWYCTHPPHKLCTPSFVCLYYTNLKNFHPFLFFCLLGICYLSRLPCCVGIQPMFLCRLLTPFTHSFALSSCCLIRYK